MTDRDPYRRIAGFYDRLIEPTQSGIRRVARGVLPPRPDWRVLDVGCGTGTALVPYADLGCDVAGVDVSPAMLREAKSLLGNRADLHLVGGDRLPFENDQFDLVMTSMVLHEVAQVARSTFVAEMARVARPSGRLLLTDFRFESLRGWRGRASRTLSWVIERFSGHYAGYQSFKDSGGVPAVVADAGLTIEREKIIAGGNMAIYVATPTADP